MFQYFVGRLFGDLPSNFNYSIGKKCEYTIQLGYYELYEGKNKSTEKEVSIFIYEKRTGEKSSIKRCILNNLNYSKKLMHPNILKVLYTYENDKRIYIITEKCVPLIFEKIVRDPIWGIYEIINAVHFINSSNLIHCLISPFSIFTDSRGRWKLSVFDCIHSKECNIQTIQSFVKEHLFYQYGYFRLTLHNAIHSTYVDAYGLAVLIYWAYNNYMESSNEVDEFATDPQGIKDGNDGKVDKTIFADNERPGRIITEYFSLGRNKREYDKKESNNNNNNNNKRIDNQTRSESSILNIKNPCFKNTKESLFNDRICETSYTEACQKLDLFHINLERGKNNIPQNLHVIYDMLNNYNETEIEFNKILNNEHLKNNNTVKIMLFLTELHMKSKIEKTRFLEKLFNDFNYLSTNLKFQMILPELIEHAEIFENICLCLKIILHICKDISTDAFQKHVYPTFLKYFSLTNRSIRYVMLENLHLVEKHLNKENINEIYPHYVYGLTDDNITIKNESIKNFIYIFPQLKKSSSSSAIQTFLENLKVNDSCIRTNTIICVTKIAKYITSDKQNILENVFLVGMNDPSPQTKIATLQAIKITFDEFDSKKYVANILPIVTKRLIDENPQVRLNAFDTLEMSISLLKEELIKDQTEESPATPIKTYQFIDKIKDIIKVKSDKGIEEKNVEDNGANEDMNTMIKCKKKESDVINGLMNYGKNGSCEHIEDTRKGKEIEREQPLELDQRTYKTRNEYKYNTETENQWKKTHVLNKEENAIFEKKKKNSKGYEEYHNFSNNIIDANSDRSDDIFKNINSSIKEDHKNRSNSSHSLSVKKHPREKIPFIEKDSYYSKNTFQANLINSNTNEHKIRDLDLNKGNENNDREKKNTIHTKFKMSQQLHSNEKKSKKKVDINIDEFFDEFNLKNEGNKPKVKLSSLL